MKADNVLDALVEMGIDTIAGVPDSTLKQFCDGIQNYKGGLHHYVTANEGAAVGIAIGSYLACKRPACVYLQNSGIGNIINPVVSLANREVYGIPMLFIVGWRGEPGTKDEPQHVFQGKVTCELFQVLSIPYEVIDENTSWEEMKGILKRISDTLAKEEQYALIVKKGTFEKGEKFLWQNGNEMVREEALRTVLEELPRKTVYVSTTGKISRELYEQSDLLFGDHENLFLTVGGMGHASMIALGIAEKKPEKNIVCVDGDGAALMHMGALALIASRAPANFKHIVINNQAHESVGGMPTGCRNTDFSQTSKTLGYAWVKRVDKLADLKEALHEMEVQKGPALLEVLVSLESRSDLGRPRESARANKESFMKRFTLK